MNCCKEHILECPETSDCPMIPATEGKMGEWVLYGQHKEMIPNCCADGGVGFDEYQRLAFTTAIYPNKGNNIYYPALGLGEVGEIQGKIKKIMRDDNGVITDKKREEIKKEVGDALWYIAALATELGLSLNDIAQSNLDKLFDRKERGVIKGSGDNR